MLGDAEAVIDRRVAAGRIEPGGGAQVGRRHAGDRFGRLGRVPRIGDEGAPEREIFRLAALLHIGFVDQAFGRDHMRERGDDRDVGAGLQREVIVRLDMRVLHQVDAPGIDDDQARTLADPLLHAAAEHRMGVGRVGAHDQDDIRVHDGIKRLGTGRGAERGAEAVAGRRVADPGAGIDVVVAEGRADQLLHQVRLFIGAARRGDAADGPGARMSPGSA